MVTAAEIAVRTLLAVVFGTAFFTKVRSRLAYREYATSLAGIGWLRGHVRAAAVALIPALEALVATLLIIPVPISWGCAAGAVLLAAFTAVTGRELARGNQIRCRCFGASGGQIGPSQIARNFLLLACATTGLALSLAHGDHASAGARVLAIGLAALAGMLIVRWDDLLTLVRPQ